MQTITELEKHALLCHVVVSMWGQITSHARLLSMREFLRGGLRGAADGGEREFSNELRFLYQLAAVRFRDYE